MGKFHKILQLNFVKLFNTQNIFATHFNTLTNYFVHFNTQVFKTVLILIRKMCLFNQKN